MNDLERFFRNNTGGVIWKWTHDIEIYDRDFSRFRGRDVVVEIGVLLRRTLRRLFERADPAVRPARAMSR